MEYLQKVERIVPTLVVTLTKAAMALKMGDLEAYKHEMDRYTEVQNIALGTSWFSFEAMPFFKLKPVDLAHGCT